MFHVVWKRLLTFAAILLVFACSLTGCGAEEKSARGKDLDYTVVPTADCPADFLSEINKKKINPFQMTYDDGGAAMSWGTCGVEGAFGDDL